jgi:hypothetical protein
MDIDDFPWLGFPAEACKLLFTYLTFETFASFLKFSWFLTEFFGFD